MASKHSFSEIKLVFSPLLILLFISSPFFILHWFPIERQSIARMCCSHSFGCSMEWVGWEWHLHDEFTGNLTFGCPDLHFGLHFSNVNAPLSDLSFYGQLERLEILLNFLDLDKFLSSWCNLLNFRTWRECFFYWVWMFIYKVFFYRFNFRIWPCVRGVPFALFFYSSIREGPWSGDSF